MAQQPRLLISACPLPLGRDTHYNPLTPPSVRYTFFVIPTIPNFASSAEKALLAAEATDMTDVAGRDLEVRTTRLAVAIDNRARTRSRGYVATVMHSVQVEKQRGCEHLLTATIPAPAPAASLEGVDSDSPPDHFCNKLLKPP